MAAPGPSRSCGPGPSPGTRRVREGKSQGVSGQAGKGGPSSCHFLCDYFKIFSVEVFTGWVGPFIRARFWQARSQGGPFGPAALGQSVQTELTSANPAQPGPTDGRIQGR